MYGCIDDSVLDLAMEPEQTARDLFVAITNLFQANQETRAVVLGQEFHSMTQGDLSIDAYAQRMKHTADALRDVGHTVSEPQLVLNLLRGLNPRFANTVDIIANAAVLPLFISAHNTLRLKELRLANDAKVSSDTALTAVSPSTTSATTACTSPSCRSSSSGTNPNGGGYGARGGGGKGKGKGKGGYGARGGNNGGGSRHQQPPAASPGLLGGRPGPASSRRSLGLHEPVGWSFSVGSSAAVASSNGTSAAGPHVLRTAFYVRWLGSGRSHCLPQPDGTAGRRQPLGPRHRSYISYVPPRRYTSFPSTSFAVLHHSRQWGLHSYF